MKSRFSYVQVKTEPGGSADATDAGVLERDSVSRQPCEIFGGIAGEHY